MREATRACLVCGEHFPVSPRERNPRKWCSRRCRGWAARGLPGKPPRERTCEGCGGDISKRDTRARFCSRPCREVHRGLRLAEPYPARTCALPECGLRFVPFREGQRCCSERHGKLLYNRESRADGRQAPGPWNDRRRKNHQIRRARKKGASTGAPVIRAAIAERDGWRCHLCGKRVGKELSWPHPRSASLDHVVPLSKGGAHDPVNVRLAHLLCNTRKNDRAVGDQLILFG